MDWKISDELELAVEDFVAAADAVKQIRGKSRLEIAGDLLKLSDRLREAGVITNARLDIAARFLKAYGTLLVDVDGDRDSMEKSVQAFFFNLHIESGGFINQFDCQFYDKTSGAQLGLIAVICGKKYYVKTHQNGPS